MREHNDNRLRKRNGNTHGDHNMIQAVTMLAIGIVAVLFGTYSFFSAVHTEKSSMIVMATVTGYEEYTEGRPKGRTVFEYTVDGVAYTGYGQTIERQEYTIGQKIQVFVDQNNPRNAIPVSDNNRRMSNPVLILTISGVFLLAGLTKIRKGKEKHDKSNHPRMHSRPYPAWDYLSYNLACHARHKEEIRRNLHRTCNCSHYRNSPGYRQRSDIRQRTD